MERGKSSVVLRRVRRRDTMVCEDCVKEVRRGRFSFRSAGEGRVLLGCRFRRSSFETYTIYTHNVSIHIIYISSNRKDNIKKLIPVQPPFLINNPFPNALIPKIRPPTTKIKPLLLVQTQREQLLAYTKQRIGVV